MHLFNHNLRRRLSGTDIFPYAARLAQLPGFAFLDSRKGSPGSRYDILSALPRSLCRQPESETTLTPWMQTIERSLRSSLSPKGALLAIGFLDYDSAANQQGIAAGRVFGATAGLYDWAIVHDRPRGEIWWVSGPDCPSSTEREIARCLDTHHQPDAGHFALRTAFQPQMTERAYFDAIELIRAYIAAGDCYQVNFAQRFLAQFDGDAFCAYRRLRDVAPGDFSAFLRLTEDHAIVSLSPERFLSVRDSMVTTQPIKGTRARHADPDTDRQVAQALLNSPKDRAENVMITDLLRNDLGRSCIPGSVQTPELCALYSYENVHHLVSRVEGTLRPEVSPGQLLLNCSPGGSITGAPKKRAMEIITELEGQPRGIYCGSVFALSGAGWLESSIAIRTLELVGNDITCWGGGGITYDSHAASEYQETFDKVGVFMDALAPA